MKKEENKKMKKIKKKKEKVLMPVWLMIIFTFASKILLYTTRRIKHDRRVLKEHKDGFLLLYNHYSNKDHFIIKTALNYRRVNYVVASCYLIGNRLIRTFLTWARAISKDQFKPDLVAIRKIKKSLDQKGIVAIAPAGQTTVHGDPPFISPAIVKLIRMGKSDVVGFKTHGVYLNFPKWRKSKRRTKMTTEFVTILRKDEIGLLTDEEIYQKVVEGIYVSEDKEQLTLNRKINGKALTSGLDNILTRCPKCGIKHIMKSEKNSLLCQHCGYTVSMNNLGFFVPQKANDYAFKTVKEWYEWQKKEIGKEFLNGLELNEHVMLKSNLKDSKKLEEIGEGIITLKKDLFIYKGTILNEYVEKEFRMDLIAQLPFDSGVRFEIPNEEMFLRAYPDDVKKVIDYVHVIDYLNDLKK